MQTVFSIIFFEARRVARPPVRVRLIGNPIACGVGEVQVWAHSRVSKRYGLPPAAIGIAVFERFLDVVGIERRVLLVPRVMPPTPLRVNQDHIADRAEVPAHVPVAMRPFPDNLIEKLTTLPENRVQQDFQIVVGVRITV